MEAAGIVWGSLPAWLTLCLLTVSAATFVRGSRSTAIRNLRVENDELERDCKAKDEHIRTLLAEKVRLEATRDLTPIITAMLEQSQSHETRAQDRFEKTTIILDLIAARLGPTAD